MTHEDVTTAIRLYLEEYPEEPKEINNGLCADFATVVGELLHGLGSPPEGFYYVSTPPGVCAHTWVCRKGKHYDAEAPQGVEHASKLPIFKRYRVWRKERGDAHA